jgi:hypothetical protein
MHTGLRKDDGKVSLLLKIGFDFGVLKTDLLVIFFSFLSLFVGWIEAIRARMRRGDEAKAMGVLY